jgi:hypothetical protein
MKALRNFAEWERKMYDCGFDLASTPITGVLDALALCMGDFNPDYDYDTKLGFSWIIEWTYTPDSPYFEQTRHGRTWQLEDASTLYDFLVFMNEHGWED